MRVLSLVSADSGLFCYVSRALASEGKSEINISRIVNASQLSDLATVYVGLAKGTDNQFHYRELELVTDLLVKRSGDFDRDQVTFLLEKLLTTYEGEPSVRSKDLTDSINRLGSSLSEEEKRGVLVDLSKIGLADRRFLYAEAAYIHRIAEAWGVHPIEGLSESWSILGSGSIREEALGALASLFLVVAYAPDQEISEGERETIARQLGQWIPNVEPSELDTAIRDAMAAYLTNQPQIIVERSIETIQRLIPQHQYKAIYADLRKITCSDNVLLVEERTWLERIARALGIREE